MSATFQIIKGEELSERERQLQALCSRIAALDGSVLAERTVPSRWLSTGLPRGAVVEIVGPARTDLMVKLLAEHPGWALWMEKEFSVYPLGLLQRGVDLTRLLFVECQAEASWVLGQALQSQIFPRLVASEFQFTEKELRRIQLLSERAGATTFLLSKERRPSWVPQLIMEASYGGSSAHRVAPLRPLGDAHGVADVAPELRVEILRQRGFG